MKKRLLSLIGATLLFSSSISPAYAAGSYLSNEPKQSVAIVASSGADSEIIPYADVIVYKFRLYKGVQQYRRWNETRGYWVDPYWIDVPGQ